MKAAENPGVTFRNVAGEFLAGIVETSRAAFYAMLVGALSMIAFLFWFFSYSTIGGPYGKYLPTYTNDFYGYATYRAIQLGQVEDDRPLLLVL